MALATSENKTNLLPYVLPRMQKFLLTHWGLSLYYRELEHLSAPQFGLLKLQLLSKQPFIFVGNRVFFPLFLGHQLMGVVRLNPLSGVNKKQFTQLHKNLVEVLQNSLCGRICLHKLPKKCGQLFN